MWEFSHEQTTEWAFVILVFMMIWYESRWLYHRAKRREALSLKIQNVNAEYDMLHEENLDLQEMLVGARPEGDDEDFTEALKNSDKETRKLYAEMRTGHLKDEQRLENRIWMLQSMYLLI